MNKIVSKHEQAWKFCILISSKVFLLKTIYFFFNSMTFILKQSYGTLAAKFQLPIYYFSHFCLGMLFKC